MFNFGMPASDFLSAEENNKVPKARKQGVGTDARQTADGWTWMAAHQLRILRRRKKTTKNRTSVNMFVNIQAHIKSAGQQTKNRRKTSDTFHQVESSRDRHLVGTTQGGTPPCRSPFTGCSWRAQRACISSRLAQGLALLLGRLCYQLGSSGVNDA